MMIPSVSQPAGWHGYKQNRDKMQVLSTFLKVIKITPENITGTEYVPKVEIYLLFILMKKLTVGRIFI